MALTVTIGGTAQTAYLQEGTATAKYNTFDATLVDPATVPAIGDAVALTDPTWAGLVTRVKRRPGPRPGHDYCTVSASNADTAGASAGPFGLSDTPDGSTTFGWDAGTFEVETTENLDASGSTHGMATIREEGLWPGMTFPLTCADLGYSATDFTVTDVVVTWFNGTPRYAITFGDPLVTMSVWLNSASAGILPITRTKITDGEVTTPKLAANAVTTAKLLVADGLGGNLCPNGSFQLGTGIDFGYAPGVSFGWVNWLGVESDGVSDGRCFRGDVVGPSAEGRMSLPEMRLLGGRKVMVSYYVRNAGAGSPRSRLLLLTRKSTTAQWSYDYVDVDDQSTPTDGGDWVRRTIGPLTLASDVVAGFITVGIISNAGVSAGYESQMRFEDIQVEYGEAVTSYGPSFFGSNVSMDSSGITITNGALTVKNASVGTVIIDGTSNMFKIAATGTLTVAGSCGTEQRRVPH